MGKELSKTYEPKGIEEKWLKFWLEKKVSAAQDKSQKPPFCIVIPPPNVTGSLHIGHALDNTLQDILTRYKRMKGFNALWLPGTDHAGIATQNVVEKELAKEKKTRHEIGREKFIERVWEWKKKYGAYIIHQLQRLGASCDWSRERFTMDEGLSRAVKEAFVKLYKQGLIYRGEYLVNWCPRCHTALSDLEVEHEEKEGSLWHLKYPYKDGKGFVVVATTRPETMLGDTAVAVNPADPRYKSLHGKKLTLPLVDREISIICDHRVSQEFGTGAVKVTPAHDPNDFMMGNDHKLERINLFTIDAKMNENAIYFQGQDRYECRKNIVEELAEKGFVEKIEKHVHSIGHCYRCKTVVEPYLSIQWFVKTAPMAQKAIEAVKKGHTRIIPQQWEKTYFNWMENIRDWCISRQIWWGHRIPAWYCVGDHACKIECREPIVAQETPQKCPHCGSKNLKQDEDVLDTWFSSSLWPFSTLGWPEKTATLKTFYPTSVLVTGFDILFFWVARMMMMGLYFQGQVPFKEVYIHALIRDMEGKKMSKSKGNVIDPLTIMEEQGTDALRFTLAALAAQGRDIKLSEETIAGYSAFCNKIWNAARFLFSTALSHSTAPDTLKKKEVTNITDRWILSELSKTVKRVEDALSGYDFNVAAMSIYQFFWHSFCDWYVEFSKVSLYGDDASRKKETARVALFVLDQALRLLHPFMPFLTEELWQNLSDRRGESLASAQFPSLQELPIFSDEEEAVELLKGVVTSIRNVRGESQIAPSQALSILLMSQDQKRYAGILDGMKDYLLSLGRVSGVRWVFEKPQEPLAIQVVDHGQLTVMIPLKDIVDLGKEKLRLEKAVKKAETDLSFFDQKLKNPSFMNKAPEELVQKQREGLAAAKSRLSGFRQALVDLQS